jgi:lysophospholipase L1-like esterase
MYRRILALATVAAALAVLPSAASAATPRYYLALGDSLSQGMQPNAHGVLRDTNQGYVNDLFKTERAHARNLRLVQLGCGGETSTSMLTGKGNASNARKFHCPVTHGSQLAAAVRFLKAHHSRGQVPLVTIDIGANDVDGCASAANVGACVTAGTTAIKHNVPKILAALKKAAPAGTKFVGMNLYDPVLSGYFSSNPNTRSLAAASPLLLKEVNDDLTSADAKAGFKTADVADAFHSYDSTLTAFQGSQVPDNVATVCNWTWACTAPPRGPSIHANQHGYAVMASAFEKVIGRL